MLFLFPEPEFTPDQISARLEEGYHRIERLLKVGEMGLISQELLKMTKILHYLRANFPAAALARGPITR